MLVCRMYPERKYGDVTYSQSLEGISRHYKELRPQFGCFDVGMSRIVRNVAMMGVTGSCRSCNRWESHNVRRCNRNNKDIKTMYQPH